MGKIDPHIDNQTIKHDTGFYRGSYANNKWYYMQEPTLDPPVFPNTFKKDKVWENICREDERGLVDHIARQSKLTTRSDDKKRKKPDEVDVINRIMTLKQKKL